MRPRNLLATSALDPGTNAPHKQLLTGVTGHGNQAASAWMKIKYIATTDELI
jgi:hypothetical protein